MHDLPEPDWYLDNVLVHSMPGDHSRIVVGPAATWQAWWDAQIDGVSELGRLALAQGLSVTTRQLREAGFRDHALRREVRRGTWTVSGRGAASPIAVSGTDHLATRRRHALAAGAAALLHPDQVVSGRSAAILHGLPTMATPALPETTSAGQTLGRRPRVHVHGAALHVEETTAWFGAASTTWRARWSISLATTGGTRSWPRIPR